MKHRGLILSTRLLLVLVNILIAAVVFYFFLKKSHHALYESTAHGDEYVVANYENAKLEDAIMLDRCTDCNLLWLTQSMILAILKG